MDTASGDTELTPADQWVLLDDANQDDFYEPAGGGPQQPPLGIAVHDGQALAPSSVSYQGIDLTQRWQLTIPAQGRVGLMQVMTGQADRTRGRASAARLAQLPPELLVGMTPDEGASIANFAVPQDLVSALPPLPIDGIIAGRVWGADGATPVPGAVMKFRSRSPHYGRLARRPGRDGRQRVLLDPARLHPGQRLLLVPREPFDVRAQISTGASAS